MPGSVVATKAGNLLVRRYCSICRVNCEPQSEAKPDNGHISRCNGIVSAMENIIYALIEDTHNQLGSELRSIDGMDSLIVRRHRRFDSIESVASWISDVSSLGMECTCAEKYVHAEESAKPSSLESNIVLTNWTPSSILSCDLDRTLQLVPLPADYRPSMWDVVRKRATCCCVASHDWPFSYTYFYNAAADMWTRQEQLWSHWKSPASRSHSLRSASIHATTSPVDEIQNPQPPRKESTWRRRQIRSTRQRNI